MKVVTTMTENILTILDVTIDTIEYNFQQK